MDNTIKDSYHFVGATHPLSPFIFVGYNVYVSWTTTMGYGDTTDFLKLPKTSLSENLTYLENHDLWNISLQKGRKKYSLISRKKFM